MDKILDKQYELRELLFCRPLDVDKIEIVAIQLCDLLLEFNDIEK